MTRETFRRVYNHLRSRSGHEDRFENHPGWDTPTGKNNFTPWDRLAIAAKEQEIEQILPGYIFSSLKRAFEDYNAASYHPHFLLRPEIMSEYKRTYPSTVRGIEIRWNDQRLIFDSGMKHVDTMQWFAEPSAEEKEKYVLLSENNQFSDLFVFYMAAIRGFVKLEEETRDNARFEYFLFPAVYDSLINNNDVLKKLK